ncbi:ferrichrome-binding periplasmic protein precursor [Gracilibacillus boraciitolerans JCM 21714]|uniref:Ferrichrome-binding periplasmic protein n=2 Tax=Gracilibacillus boraciitolerans TaxID=307521 RepID=W4VGZ8_9BACI|nr:ferrichrome-binding periplasmic protein precursor [Gracilibacillus boraciitolerans JCM 21714]
MPLEQVLSYQPDLLILSTVDSMTGQLTDYEEIAPTYVFKPEDHNDIRQQIKIIGEIVGKSDEAEARLNEYDSKVTEAKEQLVNTVGDETVAIIWVAGDQYFMFEQDRHAAKVLYEELGLTPSALTVELGAAEANWNPISLEKLAELEADHLFLLAEEGVTGVDALENSSVYQNLKAVQNDHVYHYTDPSNWTNKGIIAYEKTIEDVTEAFNN